MENQITDWKKAIQTTNELNGLIATIQADSSSLEIILAIAANDKSSIKYRCTKLVRLVSEQHPELVIPYFANIAKLLQQANHFMLWDAILILGNLARTDPEHRFDGIYQDYFGLLQAPDMITAANVAGQAAKIILARPDLEADITNRLLAVPAQTFYMRGQASPECSRVICGQLIDCFDQYFNQSSRQDDIVAFVRSQLDNPRRPVARKAEIFIKKHA